MSIDATTFAANNTTITTDIAAIVTAYAANKAALKQATQDAYANNASSVAVAGQLAGQYPAEVAKAMIAAGLRDVFEAARDQVLDNVNDMTINGAGATGLTNAWTARINAGQLGPHT